MDLQGVYDSISKFWNTIFPLLVAHVILLIAWLWIKRSKINPLSSLEAFLKSKLYNRWKVILDEFQLRPTIPYLTILLIIIYFVVLGDTLEFVTGGLFSPLSIVYTETDFWLETNNDTIVHEIVELNSYQGNKDASIWDANEFKRKMLEKYRTDYPEKYKSLLNWRIERNKVWNRYYQLSIAGFIIISILFAPKINKKIVGLSLKRLFFVWLVSLLLMPITRHQAEQVREDQLNAELIFVNGLLRQDSTYTTTRLTQNEQDVFTCKFYNSKISEMDKIRTTGDSRRFWLSRYLEPIFIRVFTTAPDIWQPPPDCVVITP